MSKKESLQLNLEQLELISRKIYKLLNINLVNIEVKKAETHYKAIESILLNNEGELKTSLFEHYYTESKRLLNTIVKYRNKLLENQYATSLQEVQITSESSPTPQNIDNKTLTKNQETMANENFDIKIATAIVQTYNGDEATFDTFADSINLLRDLTKPEHMQLAIRFVKTRLAEKARLGLVENPTSLDEIIADVKQRCTGKTTPENILAKLKTLKPKADTNVLCDDIDTLAGKLKATYVSQGIPETVAKTMATKAGVDALISTTTNYETKIILKAGTFQNLQDAIMKVRENDTQVSIENSQVLAYNIRRFGNSNRYSRGNPRLRNNNQRVPNVNQGYRYNNNQRGNTNRSTTNHARNEQQVGRHGYQNQNNSRRYNQNYTTRGNNRNNQSRRVYHTNTHQHDENEDSRQSTEDENNDNNFLERS